MKFYFIIAILFASNLKANEAPGAEKYPFSLPLSHWPFSSSEAKLRQSEIAKTFKVPIEKKINLGNGIFMEFVLIPPGRFIMGTPPPKEPKEDIVLWAIFLGASFFLILFLRAVKVFFETKKKSGNFKIYFQFALWEIVVYFNILAIGVGCGIKGFKAKRQMDKFKEEMEFYEKVRHEEEGHEVEITTPYYIGKFEVTQGQFMEICKKNFSCFKDMSLPVTNISWNDAYEFVKKIQDTFKVNVRLPSEAEWEFACRAGTSDLFNSGNSIKDLDLVAWWNGEVRQPQKGGQKLCNAFGLFDFHGNVLEFCQDWYAPFTKEPKIDPFGPKSGGAKILKGGYWKDSEFYCRSAARCGTGPDYGNHPGWGFRIVLDLN